MNANGKRAMESATTRASLSTTTSACCASTCVLDRPRALGGFKQRKALSIPQVVDEDLPSPSTELQKLSFTPPGEISASNPFFFMPRSSIGNDKDSLTSHCQEPCSSQQQQMQLSAVNPTFEQTNHTTLFEQADHAASFEQVSHPALDLPACCSSPPSSSSSCCCSSSASLQASSTSSSPLQQSSCSSSNSSPSPAGAHSSGMNVSLSSPRFFSRLTHCLNLKKGSQSSTLQHHHRSSSGVARSTMLGSLSSAGQSQSILVGTPLPTVHEVVSRSQSDYALDTDSPESGFVVDTNDFLRNQTANVDDPVEQQVASAGNIEFVASAPESYRDPDRDSISSTSSLEIIVQ
ncbi:unnamed protein product [Toxocara canis]|uniref:Uncharacterized protein n=1 Tax=Toxocara canis TaxID=6265 RepID=A0A183U166_TOXCA|nr:unnamed protein product [Toxocara canis]